MKISAGLKSLNVLQGEKGPTRGYDFFYRNNNDEPWIPKNNPNQLKLIAFFCDIDHEIMKVTAGIRMTVAYLLKLKLKSTLSTTPSTNTPYITSILPK